MDVHIFYTYMGTSLDPAFFICLDIRCKGYGQRTLRAAVAVNRHCGHFLLFYPLWIQTELLHPAHTPFLCPLDRTGHYLPHRGQGVKRNGARAKDRPLGPDRPVFSAVTWPHWSQDLAPPDRYPGTASGPLQDGGHFRRGSTLFCPYCRLQHGKGKETFLARPHRPFGGWGHDDRRGLLYGKTGS